MTIYKYPFVNGHTQVIEMPEDAQILTVQVQGGLVCIWARVNADAPTFPRTFRVIGTGHDLSATDKYIGTVQQPPFVWHVFEEPA